MFNALYIEGTNKLYRTFLSEQSAIEHKDFLEVPRKNTPNLELGLASPTQRHLWSYPIHWDIINGIKLNDFDAYEHLLFMDDERVLPDRWRKFIKFDDRGLVKGVYMPFSNPQHGKEFHLNHFVYWMVLNYLKIHYKIAVYFDYNTDKCIVAPKSCCWACEYHDTIANILRKREAEPIYMCDFCPIWSTMYECENDLDSPYSKWQDEKEDVAEEIAKMPWTLFDDLVDGIFY